MRIRIGDNVYEVVDSGSISIGDGGVGGGVGGGGGWSVCTYLPAMWPGYGQLPLMDTLPPAPYHPELALAERCCKKCGNQSLRSVVMPDTGYPVALCKLCGWQEDL